MGSYAELKENKLVNGSGLKSELHIDDMELREEWQDDEFPRPLPEDAESPGDDPGDAEEGDPNRPKPPSSLALSGNRHMKKRLAAPALSLTLDRSDSVVSDEFLTAAVSPSPDDDFEINIDELETPSDNESTSFAENGNDLEWEDDLPRMNHSQGGHDNVLKERMAEDHVSEEEDSEGRKWRVFHMAEQVYRVDTSVTEAYHRVLCHGGYYGDGLNAIIVFSSCYLPENSIPNYDYVMDNLFRYIIGTLDLMVSENYILVYLNGMTPRNKIPSISWLRQCYLTIDRRLRKNLKCLLIVHPTWYIKALVTVLRPFISAKFSRKLRFLNSLNELSKLIPMEHVHIPECIQKLDQEMNGL
ncbi:BNIPL protein, partial [Polypterus senegalus]|nr:bcl-2/adenovirus E1B 19 kDa-interacting protein 2-like protein isoform X1 [Polypterus senegalus]MBN3294064.1 BNIPL protein [Polypterus senegalus]